MELVMRAAAALTPEPRIRFAALMHDLGKGRTPRSQWPRHIGHEESGAKLVGDVCARLRVPAEFRELAVLAARWHGLVHRAEELRPRTVLDLLGHCDAFRRPERFRELLIACEADHRGRGGGFGDRPYPQAARLRGAQERAAAVALDATDREGLTGEQIGERLRRRRLAALKA
jgi:tRNA nucleotidyltransferase (CCA-adding enzyme)